MSFNPKLILSSISQADRLYINAKKFSFQSQPGSISYLTVRSVIISFLSGCKAVLEHLRNHDVCMLNLSCSTVVKLFIIKQIKSPLTP